MREINKLKGKFKINESIREIPINRYKDFQKYLVQDAGIGSTMDDVDRHFKNFDSFLQSGKLDEAIKERYNLHYNLYLMLNRIDIKSLAFGCLVHSIDGEEIADYSENSLNDITERIGSIGLNRGELEDILSDLKKKLIAS